MECQRTRDREGGPSTRTDRGARQQVCGGGRLQRRQGHVDIDGVVAKQQHQQHDPRDQHALDHVVVVVQVHDIGQVGPYAPAASSTGRSQPAGLQASEGGREGGNIPGRSGLSRSLVSSRQRWRALPRTQGSTRICPDAPDWWDGGYSPRRSLPSTRRILPSINQDVFVMGKTRPTADPETTRTCPPAAERHRRTPCAGRRRG